MFLTLALRGWNANLTRDQGELTPLREPQHVEKETSDMRTDMLRTAVLTVALLTIGCTTNRFNTPLGTFRSDIQAGNAIIGDFYRTRNAYERKLYLLSVFVNKDQEVLFIGSDGPTPLGSPVFSEDSLKARLDALRLVGVYADRLAELAGSSAPSKFSEASALLGTNLTSLPKQFENLASHNTKDTQDTTASKFIEPITNLVRAIGTMI
jgi:hypothetical protein